MRSFSAIMCILAFLSSAHPLARHVPVEAPDPVSGTKRNAQRRSFQQSCNKCDLFDYHEPSIGLRCTCSNFAGDWGWASIGLDAIVGNFDGTLVFGLS